MSNVLDKLRALHALATLRPEEESNESRVNEARNAAAMVFKVCREHGVTISYKAKKETSAASNVDAEDMWQKINRTPPGSAARQRFVDEFLRDVSAGLEKQRRKREADPAWRAQQAAERKAEKERQARWAAEAEAERLEKELLAKAAEKERIQREQEAARLHQERMDREAEELQRANEAYEKRIRGC